MALKFLSTHSPSGGSSSSVKLFDVRLDTPYVVFRGSEDEAGSANLAGQLVLSLVEPLNVTGITLTLSGIVHMGYYTASSSSLSGRRNTSKEKTFFQKTWTFRDAGKGKTETLPSDNYVWPFDLILDGTLPESVEGLKDAYIVYRFKAEIGRKRAKDIVIRKPLRIIRTLGPSDLELSHAMSVENVWPNKIEYSISTPSKAVVFGSFLQVDFKLIPLLKGLVVGTICTQLKEEHEFIMDPDWGVNSYNGGMMKDDRIIAYDNYRLDAENDMQIIEESAEGFQFSRYLELPKTLTRCMQDCNAKGIKIRHKIKFNVQLLNPDGHVSELRANLPVSLYISESLPLNENNALVDQTPQAGRAAMQHDMFNSAPPLYGEHQFDQLFSDLDPLGWRTPGAALSTTGTPFSHSRNISAENLSGLDAVVDAPGHVSASALQHRLQDLRRSDRVLPTGVRDDTEQSASGTLSRRGSNTQVNGDYFSHGNDTQEPRSHNRSRQSSRGTTSRSNSLSNSNSASRRSSNEDPPCVSGTASPFLPTPNYDNLAKVPSYSTALRTPAPRTTGPDNELPSYRSCMADPGPSPPAAPASVHLRDNSRSAALISASYPPTPDIHITRPPINRNLSQLQDEERRQRGLPIHSRS